jgi:hypothetical protein
MGIRHAIANTAIDPWCGDPPAGGSLVKRRKAAEIPALQRESSIARIAFSDLARCN